MVPENKSWKMGIWDLFIYVVGLEYSVVYSTGLLHCRQILYQLSYQGRILLVALILLNKTYWGYGLPK